MHVEDAVGPLLRCFPTAALHCALGWSPASMTAGAQLALGSIGVVKDEKPSRMQML